MSQGSINSLLRGCGRMGLPCPGMKRLKLKEVLQTAEITQP